MVRSSIHAVNGRQTVNVEGLHSRVWIWVGSNHGSGRVGSNCMGLCGSPWMIQNVCSCSRLDVHCAYTGNQKFI